MDKIHKEQFLNDYKDEYPKYLTQCYDMLECLNQKDAYETILGVEKKSGKKVIIKCYDKAHPLFEVTEPDSLRRLEHPRIPVFLEEYQSQTQRFVIREYIEGQTLADYASQHTFKEQEIIHFGIELCDILQYLHTQVPPVIHRDIKPQNIVVRQDGTFCLIDFDISRVFKEEEKTDTVWCGTKDYAAPEQYGYMQTGVYSDIWSLGTVMTWLLTGKAKPIENADTPFKKVLAQCTAFAPENRFRDVGELKQKLKALLPEAYRQKRKRKTISFVALFMAVMIAVIAGGIYQGKGVRFQEPLIEEAVRVTLDISPSEILTKQDLEEVTEIYIMANQVYSSLDDYYEGFGKWFANELAYGEIISLSDLEAMPNLKIIHIGAEQITDISPLRNLSELEVVDFPKNNISDISALAGKQKLTEVGFNDNSLKDISVLATCPALSAVDIRDATADGCSGAVIAEIDNYILVLDISNRSDAYKYLDGKSIRILKLGSPGLKDLECIRDTAYIEQLYTYWSEITDISALEGREDIVYLNMAGCIIEDLSPLLTMPNLQTVVLSYQMRDAMEQISDEPSFTIEYQG